MNQLALADLAFPKRNKAVEANWLPIYVEPMIGSGEKICVGIAVSSKNGSLVVPVAGLERLKCLYGAESEIIRYSSELVLGSVGECLQKKGETTFTQWNSPIEGFTLGTLRKGDGNSLEEIARNGLTLCASLVEKLVDEAENSSDNVTKTKLETEVKKNVLNRQPSFERFFNRKRTLGVNVRPVPFGFVGERFAANFGLIVPPDITVGVSSVKSSVFDLTNLRVNYGDDLFNAELKQFGVMIYSPSADNPAYSNKQINNAKLALNELEMELEKADVRMSVSSDTAEIADRVIEYELRAA